jgi:quercetin 2,3-dioxygenase
VPGAGAWCFLDRYGPDDTSAGPGMRVPPHLHIGLQTASWLFEYGVLAADGPAGVGCPAIAGAPARIEPGMLAHLPVGVPSITVSASGPSRLFIVGGIPLGDRLVMWWNFVARTNEEIVTARNAWVAGAFGEVRGYIGEPLAAPPLPPGGLKPRLRNNYGQ